MASWYCKLWLPICGWLLLPISAAASENAITLLHHDMAIRIEVASRRIEASDTVTIQSNSEKPFYFTLHPDAYIHSLTHAEKAVPYQFEKGVIQISRGAFRQQGDLQVTIKYTVVFHDDIPKESVYSEDPSYGVTGVISKEGLLLMDDSRWYPNVPGSISTYRIQVNAPQGMEVVTAGTHKERKVDGSRLIFVWEMDQPVRGVSLSGGPYMVKEDRAGQIPLFLYCFKNSEQLVSPYFSAVKRYIALYQHLFGPYPFSKFAVVENFFPTGYGFPSYTLLGSQVMRLPFIVDTSLGHEVAHSWWGNGVLVDYAKGNWSEGLTTYVADHLYKEKASLEEAREYRARILRNYVTLVSSREDFPLREFIGRNSPASRAVGYGKVAMLFHMARRLMGDDGFWQSLQEVYRNRLFQEASWDDFAGAFAARSREDFHAFFKQWVDRPGAPSLRLEGMQTVRVGEKWRITGSLVQEKPFYQLRIPMRLETEEGDIHASIHSNARETIFFLEAGSRPKRLLVDPEVHVFRRLHPEEMPPDINTLKGSDSLAVVMASGSGEMLDGAARILLAALGRKGIPVFKEKEIMPAQLEGKDLLLFGLPQSEPLLPTLPESVTAARDHFSLDGKEYRAPNDGVFLIMGSATDRSRSVGLFLAFSEESASALARKISHYGSYSALVIQEGNVTVKKVWPVSDSPLIHHFMPKE